MVPTCTKAPFDSLKQANIRIAQIKDVHKAGGTGKSAKRPKRAYKCDKCGKWHLTSKTIQESELYQRIHLSSLGKQAYLALRDKYGEMPNFEKFKKRKNK